MSDNAKQQARKDAASAIRILCAVAGDLAAATQVLAKTETKNESKQALFSNLIAADKKKRLLLFREIRQKLAYQGVYIKFG
ncbi:hypothetical protein LCGC14_0691400 [marine sediment metagenome]|uniref:Uncharacterized protein n=1 Tax=marine sediment metagenome TaxID=412755 RepID=A0A0F9R5P1_9ZZZZ